MPAMNPSGKAMSVVMYQFAPNDTGALEHGSESTSRTRSRSRTSEPVPGGTKAKVNLSERLNYTARMAPVWGPGTADESDNE